MSMADSLPGSENRLLALIEFRRRFDEIRQVRVKITSKFDLGLTGQTNWTNLDPTKVYFRIGPCSTERIIEASDSIIFDSIYKHVTK